MRGEQPDAPGLRAKVIQALDRGFETTLPYHTSLFSSSVIATLVLIKVAPSDSSWCSSW